ncbi:MAG: transposase [Bacteroidota bacterium]|jgi:REP element-mobilizing transposase RayT
MGRRSIQFIPGEYYHIYNRGNNKQKIFMEPENYRFFLRRLHYYFDRANIEIAAYCLMPNHFHLLVRIRSEIDVSNVMRSFSVSYIKSYNKWYRRCGHLFQGDFRALHIDDENYLRCLCRYIHLNPVNAHLVKRPEDWKFSDYREWVAVDADALKVNHRLRDELFGTAAGYQAFVRDYRGPQKAEAEIEEFLLG